MSDQDRSTPRVFIVRHGETTWAKKGRFTGKTDIALTEEGEAQVSHAATKAVGPGKLIDPQGLGTIYVSPRLRAKQTLDLLVPDAAERGIIRNEIEEWDYGHYEGLTIDKIKELRRTRGLDKDEEWNIWSDGCEGGESKEQVTDRLDRLISEVRQIQKASMDGRGAADILIVAHGLILRCFAKRWIGFEIDASLELMMDPGAIAVLSYKNKDIDKPAIHLDHPDTLMSMNNLVHTWQCMGMVLEATESMRGCVRLSRFKLGLNHGHTKASVSTLDDWVSRLST